LNDDVQAQNLKRLQNLANLGGLFAALELG